MALAVFCKPGIDGGILHHEPYIRNPVWVSQELNCNTVLIFNSLLGDG